MEYQYKIEIANLVENPRWGGFFRIPASGVIKEYPLIVSNNLCRADFCYEFQRSGKLFIEDDDAPRALNNLIKYWEWCLQNRSERPIHLIHIISAKSGVQLEHCRFLKGRIEKDLEVNEFHYHIIPIGRSWDTPEKWLHEVSKILMAISEMK